jgi:hypothetical protein
MLDLVYLALVAAPLTMAAAAMLLMALRSYRGHADVRAERRQAQRERALEHPGGLRKRSEPLVDPPSIGTLGDVRSLGRSVMASLANDPSPERDRPSIEELSELVESLAYPPREVPARTAPAPVKREVPRVGAPRAATKHCPDCAEEVLAAARVCKHCRYRFDEPGELRVSV